MSDATLHATMSAEARGLRTQLLLGPGTDAALLQLTAACQSLHSQHTAKQKQRQRGNCSSADAGTAGPSSRSYSRSSKSRGGSRPSCSYPSPTSAQGEAASLLLPPDHQLMVAQFGERSVAALEAYLKTECTGTDFTRHIACCVDVLGESAEARWEQQPPRASNEISRRSFVAPAALHKSVDTSCLGSAAGLQLLLEVIGLLVAEGNHTGAVIEACALLLNSATGVTEAERRVFLAARGELLVQVFQLGLQQQQQQCQGAVEMAKGIVVFSILKTMALLVAGPCNGEIGEVVAMYLTLQL